MEKTPKTMRDEMNEEWAELAMENIHKLIPKEWMPRINEILPKVLNIVKIGIKKNIKNMAEQLGPNKMYIIMNMPAKFKDSDEVIMIPSYLRIDKSQLGPSKYNKATGEFELQLKAKEVPEVNFSMMTLAEKINSYNKIEDLIADVKNNKFLTLKDINYKPQKEDKELPHDVKLLAASIDPSSCKNCGSKNVYKTSTGNHCQDCKTESAN